MHRIVPFLLLAAAGLPAPRAAAEPARVVESWMEAARSEIPGVSTERLKALVNGDRSFVLLDVRLPGERQSAGAIDPFREVAIPRGYLEFRAPRKLPDTGATIIVYCGTGKRSLLAARTLERMGYTDVRNYSDGFRAWKEAGHPVQPPMSAP
ncbi:rhodanese-like domain-containing protein [Thiohalorhabdus methylotrophus]|uniref:Rhodanese-like domain-containing protein n=1 Tax=Thiohalorhabdus methylotrophus TaxID=3242694 RepID=A0ABV4TXI6_9GAMM